jgi:TatD DNase family protein
MLVDTHAHLASNPFSDDLPETIERSIDAGVTRIVSIATDLEDSQQNIEIADRYDAVYATVGVHPTSVHEIADSHWSQRIREWAQHPKVVAIGEIGLDYFHPPRDGSKPSAWRNLQIEYFQAQLDLAVELQMPVVIHQRDKNGSDHCASDLQAIIRGYQGRIRAVFHCFTGPPEQALPILDQGHLISFTGIATFPSAKDLQNTARQVPDDKFMLETDSPYLAPIPFRGKRCEPAYTRHTAEQIATLRQVSLQEIAAITTGNAERFFKF